MGRPLNKKYFGNRNIGTNGRQETNAHNYSNQGDDAIGGEGIANFTVGTAGNYINRLPTLATFSAPTIPGGVQATGVVHSRAQSASPAADGINYWVGDQITDANGSVWRVAELELLSATMTNPGTGYGADDNIPYANGVVINVDSITGGGGFGPIGTYHVQNRGSFTTPGAAPTTSGAQGGTLGGHDAAFTLVWRIKTLAFVSSVDYVYGTTYLYGTDNVTTGGHGTLAALNVGFSPDHLAVTQKGSGYTGAETITFTTAPNMGEVRATGTIVLTTDSGAPGSATNQENAIIIHANTSSGGTTAKVGDIIKQTATRNYKVKTADGIKVCKLGTTATPAPKGAYIIATDNNGNTYFVTKLTAHKATLAQYTQNGASPWLYTTTHDVAKWSFEVTSAPAFGDLGTVLIENA